MAELKKPLQAMMHGPRQLRFTQDPKAQQPLEPDGKEQDSEEQGRGEGWWVSQLKRGIVMV